MRLFILITFITLEIVNASGQSLHPGMDDLSKELNRAADSVRSRYYEYKLLVSSCDTVGFSVNHVAKQFTIRIPCVDASYKLSAELFNIVQKLSLSGNYYDKIVAHQIYMAMIPAMVKWEESLPDASDEQKQITALIKQIVHSDARNCMRITDDAIMGFIKARHMNAAIVEVLASILREPQRTREDAAVIVSSRRAYYNLTDTIGYSQKKQLLKKGHKEHKSYVEKITDWIKWSNAQNMSLKAWLEMKEQRVNADFVKSYMQSYVSLHMVIAYVGEFKVLALASPLEGLYLANVSQYNRPALLALCRLGYKDYETAELKRLAQELQTLDNLQVSNALSILNDLVYIDSQDSYYAAAPFLISKMTVPYLNNYCSLGALSFDILRQHITNFPEEFDDIIARASENGNIGVIAVEVIDEAANNGFLDRMHIWMLQNKGNYRINSF